MPIHTHRNQVLSRIRPGGEPQDAARWQQRKSSRTREVMLEAAIDCLVESGYSGLTTIKVAERAGVSRGAMHHHFASRAVLVSALVDHVLYRRMRHFLDEYLRDITMLPKQNALAIATELYWRSVQSREYEAYIELAVAARSDPDLERAFTPAARRFDSVWNEEMERTFPNWSHAREEMRLTSDLVQSTYLGLLINQSIIGEARAREQRALVVEVVKRVHGGLKGKQADLPDFSDK